MNHKSWISVGGGRKSKVAELIDGELLKHGWRAKNFDTKITVDERSLDSPTHEVDCFKNGVALEIEWNNKDPFYDRDLNNFRLLFDLRVVSVGIIITRSDELQGIFDNLGRGSSYGASTTHMSKLLPRVLGGGAGLVLAADDGFSGQVRAADPVGEAGRKRSGRIQPPGQERIGQVRGGAGVAAAQARRVLRVGEAARARPGGELPVLAELLNRDWSSIQAVVEHPLAWIRNMGYR